MIQVSKVRVVVVQGYCLLRNALIDRLEQEPWIEVCGAAAGIDEARELIDEHRPQVLVINVSIKCSTGVSSLKKLKRDYYGLAVIALSCDSEFENTSVGHLLRAGADGYVSSGDSLDSLIIAIRTAHEKRRYVSEDVLKEQGRQQSVLIGLSRQEAEVFCLTGCGYVTRRIANKLGVGTKTVDSYRERIRKKMGFTGSELLYVSTSLMRSAARRGVPEAEEEMVKELLSARD